MPAHLDITKDIQPLTTFRNNSVKLIRQLKRTQRPIILTVNGKPEAVLQDPAAYQRQLDLAAAFDASEGIRQGLAELSQGEGRPAAKLGSSAKVLTRTTWPYSSSLICKMTCPARARDSTGLSSAPSEGLTSPPAELGSTASSSPMAGLSESPQRHPSDPGGARAPPTSPLGNSPYLSRHL